MKNLGLFLVLILTFSVLISCSKDDNSENQLVVKKITEEVFYSTNSDVTEEIFIYENNKFVKSIGSDGKYVSFVYDGDKVTTINRYSANNELINVTNLNYEGENLVSVQSNSSSSITRFLYQNGKLIKKEYGINTSLGFEVQGKTDLSYDANNNNSEVINSFFGQTPEVSKSTYTYDDKNNPIKFMNKYLKLIFSTEGITGLSSNNKLTQTSYFPITSTTPSQYIYQLTYNSDNYPTNIKRLTQSGTLISSTTIEYQSN